jgi:hypothetical protein
MQFIKRPSHHPGKDPNSISRCCSETASEVSDLQCLCGDTETQQPDLENSPAWATGILKTSRGPVSTTSHRLTWVDYFGEIKSRVSGFRMKYSIPPGLYAVGKPDRDSDILVTANYKLSFDKLRMHLKDQHVWILVLDTNSINVWCAAGKGTFGTEELVKRMQAARLDILVTHRRIILPQLSAPGVNAKEVRKQTGFRVYFGPVHDSYGTQSSDEEISASCRITSCHIRTFSGWYYIQRRIGNGDAVTGARHSRCYQRGVPHPCFSSLYTVSVVCG